MGLFNRMKRGGVAAASVQTNREAIAGGFGGLVPLYSRDCALYDQLRGAIPVVDAAIDKICRLVGGCAPVCDDPVAQKELEGFFREVPVGATSCGIESFLRCYLDSLLTYGNAVGEVVLDGEGKAVAGLYNAPLENILFREGDNPLELEICVAKRGGSPEPVPFPQLIVCSALAPRSGAVRGESILSGLPFISEVLLKIYASIGQNFERVANLRYAVTYRPGAGAVDQAYAREIAEGIATEWSGAMESSKNGRIKDFVAVGDVDIKVIGADNQMISTEVPVRQMLEQIVSKLGIPPFLLGLNWSSTERMSAQQADILTSELESYRRLLTPVLIKICRIFLRMRGYGCGADIVWDSINLQDETELANARLVNLQADQLERERMKEESL